MIIWKYNRCGSCRKAIKFLDDNNIEYTGKEILETAPSVEELQKMLGFLNGDLKKLFNTSGVKYREGNYKDKIKTMSVDEAIKALSEDGALVKRPFVLAENFGTVGFKEEIWTDLFKL